MVPGLYPYAKEVVEIVNNLKASSREELGITQVDAIYLKRSQLRVHRLGRGFA